MFLQHSAYSKEAERILRKQQEFNKKITDEFIEDYLTILTGKRKYYHGPGNEKSRTDYGRYTTKKDPEGKYITLDNIFGILIGNVHFILMNIELQKLPILLKSSTY